MNNTVGFMFISASKSFMFKLVCFQHSNSMQSVSTCQRKIFYVFPSHDMCRCLRCTFYISIASKVIIRTSGTLLSKRVFDPRTNPAGMRKFNCSTFVHIKCFKFLDQTEYIEKRQILYCNGV
jgi:hypothetical protein